MADIILAIIYYFTMLFSEIAILYNEDSNRRRLERSAREGARRGDSKESSKSARGAGRLVDAASGEIDTGRVDSSTNPLFLSQGGQGGAKITASPTAGGAGGGVSALMASRSLPAPELWPIVQSEFAAAQQQIEALQTQLTEAKKAALSEDAPRHGSGGGGGGGGGGGIEEASSARKAAAKKSFSAMPAGAAGSAATKLKAKRSAQQEAF